MSNRCYFNGRQSGQGASYVCGLCSAFLGLAVLAWGDDTKQNAEKDFGPVAAQAEWLKTPPLPAWTEMDRFEENDVEYFVAATDAVMSAADAEADLDREMQRVVSDWIRERFSAEVATHVEIPPATIRAEWMVNHLRVPCVFELPSSAPNGAYSMYRSFAQLAMSDKVVKHVTDLWAKKKVELVELRQRDRLTQWSVIGGGLLLLLASIHSYLRMDFLTRGYHTRKLQLFLGAAIASIVGMSVWLLNVLI